MSADRRRPASAAPTKPLTPRLAGSAVAARNAPAPKLAGYATPPSSSSSSTPQNRRPLSTNTSELNITPRLAETESASNKDQVSGVTPRSSARKTRADSALSTPTRAGDDTPTQRTSGRPLSSIGSRSAALDDAQVTDAPRVSSPASFATRVQQGQGYPLIPHAANSSNRSSATNVTEERESYFFRADDAPAPKEAKPARPVLHKQTSSFMYANGEQEGPGASLSPLQTTSLPPTRPASVSMTEGLLAVDSQSSSATSPLSVSSRPVFTPPSQPSNGALRAPSPPRQGIHLSYRKGVSQIMRPSPLASHSHSRSTVGRRQSSLDGIDEDTSRARTMSVSSVESSSLKRDDGYSLLHAFAVPSSSTSPRPSPTSHPDLPAHINAFPSLDSSIERMHSPPELVESAEGGAARNDAAANARRERKILDLQISNSSLLAINRSLEKEVRKQKNELRRFKRMSRMATRESLLSQASEFTEGQNSAHSDAGDDTVSNGISIADDLDDADHDDESESDDIEDGTASSGAASERDARYKKGDQRRLLVDLAKHKELLADSQRMNQSIVKCLGVTEQLIKDGNRALEYQVSLDEVRLGGRVLAPEEQEDAEMSYIVEHTESLGLDDPRDADTQPDEQRVDSLLEQIETDLGQAGAVDARAVSAHG